MNHPLTTLIAEYADDEMVVWRLRDDLDLVHYRKAKGHKYPWLLIERKFDRTKDDWVDGDTVKLTKPPWSVINDCGFTNLAD